MIEIRPTQTLEIAVRNSIGGSIERLIPIGDHDIELDYEARYFALDLARKDSTLNDIGVLFTQEEQGISLSLPSAEALNVLLAKIGHKDRCFTAVEGGRLQARDYLQLISAGEIPIATDPWFLLHDTAGHGPGFLLTPARAMGIFRDKAAQALLTDEDAVIREAAAQIDSFSALAPSAHTLAHLYSKSMKYVYAGILAKKDMHKVERARKVLKKISP